MHYLPLAALFLIIPSDVPFVKITGPTERPFGRSVILKIDYKGDDVKVAVSPENPNWYMVKFFPDDKIGIIFDPDKEGIYTFAVAVNANGKTAVAAHRIQIGRAPPEPEPGPGPTPGPLDEFTKKLQSAFTTDKAAGVGSIEQRKQLSANYKVGADTFIPALKTNKELYDKQKELNEKAIGKGTLPQVRAVIAAEVTSVLGSNSALALDKEKAKTLWIRISESLAKVTP